MTSTPSNNGKLSASLAACEAYLHAGHTRAAAGRTRAARLLLETKELALDRCFRQRRRPARAGLPVIPAQVREQKSDSSSR